MIAQPGSARRVVGVAAALLGMAVLTGLAVYWLADGDALPRALDLQVEGDDARELARVASAFRAGFDLFAVAVMALPLARHDWPGLGRVALLTAVAIPGVDAVIWWAVLEDPGPVDLLPHLLVALPLLAAAAALWTAAEGTGTDPRR